LEQPGTVEGTWLGLAALLEPKHGLAALLETTGCLLTELVISARVSLLTA